MWSWHFVYANRVVHKNKIPSWIKTRTFKSFRFTSLCSCTTKIKKKISLQKTDRINYLRALNVLHLCWEFLFSIVIKFNFQINKVFVFVILVSAKFFTLISPAKTAAWAIFVRVILNFIWVLPWRWGIYPLIATIPRFLIVDCAIVGLGTERDRCMSFLTSFL